MNEVVVIPNNAGNNIDRVYGQPGYFNEKKRPHTKNQ